MDLNNSYVLFETERVKVLYECGTWSLTLRSKHRLRVFENKVLTRIFGSRRDEVTGRWRNCITRSFMIYTLCQA
jgi:hypothetical protein